ncbi:hypothetical protein P167DRAFT_545590 [Morchella conica CCBAS932]|uniref:Uncharacterized protein n=1 Tax=Morchella conica CCBAS932 TaxID=1392247 RepID=A0A3N4KVI0_9PEZI|nr:hypothetical protein P167DRAFT_545590 [Morchella conica CCBAS932]
MTFTTWEDFPRYYARKGCREDYMPKHHGIDLRIGVAPISPLVDLPNPLGRAARIVLTLHHPLVHPGKACTPLRRRRWLLNTNSGSSPVAVPLFLPCDHATTAGMRRKLAAKDPQTWYCARLCIQLYGLCGLVSLFIIHKPPKPSSDSFSEHRNLFWSPAQNQVLIKTLQEISVIRVQLNLKPWTN